MSETFDFRRVPDYLDVSAVRTNSTKDDVLDCARLAKEYDCLAVFSLSCFLPTLRAERERLGDDFLICGTIGFPSGQMSTKMKVAEAKLVKEIGVDECDMMLNVGYLLSGMYDEALADIKAVKEIIDPLPLKVIIEAPLLNDDQLRKATEIVVASEAAWVKTGTGWPANATTMDQVRIIREVLGNDSPVKLKAAGGVRNLATIEEMFTKYGVRRFGIGYASVKRILDEIKEREKNA